MDVKMFKYVAIPPVTLKDIASGTSFPDTSEPFYSLAVSSNQVGNSEEYQPFLLWVISHELKLFKAASELGDGCEPVLFDTLYLEAEKAFREASELYDSEDSKPFLRYAFEYIRKRLRCKLARMSF